MQNRKIMSVLLAFCLAGIPAVTQAQAARNKRPPVQQPAKKQPPKTAAATGTKAPVLSGNEIYRAGFPMEKLPAKTTSSGTAINTQNPGGMYFLQNAEMTLPAKKDLSVTFRFFFHDAKKIRLNIRFSGVNEDRKKRENTIVVFGDSIHLNADLDGKRTNEVYRLQNAGLPNFRGQVWYDAKLVFDCFGSCTFYLKNTKNEFIRIGETTSALAGCKNLRLGIQGNSPGQLAALVAEAVPAPASPVKKIPGGQELIAKGTLGAELSSGNDQLSFDVRFGYRGGEMVLEFANGAKTVIPVRLRAEKHMPDSVLMFEFPSIQVKREPKFDAKGREIKEPPRTVDYYARPRLDRYSGGNINKFINANNYWQTLAPASQKLVHMEIHQTGNRVRLYADGRYFACEPAPAKLSRVSFRLGSTAALLNVQSGNRPDESRFLAIDGSRIARPGAMKNAKITFKPGLQEIRGIPMQVLAPENSIEINQFSVMRGSEDLMFNPYLSRTALDGMRQSIHLSLPRTFYSRAWILCASEPSDAYPDPKRVMRPHFNARLTRFAGYDSWERGGNEGRGGDAIADTYLTLPWDREEENNESFFDWRATVKKIRPRSCKTCFSCVDYGFKLPESGMVEVGKVNYTTASGKQVEIPLYLVEAVLDSGKIIDLINDPADRFATMRVFEGYLDFELTRAMQNTAWSKGDSHHNPLWSNSSVNVFGVTLERAPVDMNIRQPQPGLVFFNDEKTDVPVELTCVRPGGGKLSWLVYDESGRKVRDGEIPFDMRRAGEQQTLTVHLPIEQPGWYGVDFQISDTSGRVFYRHKAACAQMGRDTRTAGYESPYGIWHFADMHNGEDKPEIYGPMLLKAGIRKIPAYTKFTEKDLVPWKLTLSQIPYYNFRGFDPLSDDPAKRKAAEDALEAHIQKYLNKFPSVRVYNIFHESFPDGLPPELFNEKPELKPDQVQYAKNRAGILNFTAEHYKKYHPGFKNTIVNTSTGAEGVAILLRGGAKRENIDFIGIESPAQSCMPEKPDKVGPQSAWLARETARKFGLDIPLSSCWESDYRVERLLGMETAAEWYARDMLLMRAYNYHNVCIGLLYDCGNSYFNTLWGGSGICYRTNLYYPKRSFAAIGTVTKMLDRATLLRRLDTASPTVYAFEYKRADNRFVQPFWMPSGAALLEFEFETPSEVTLTGTYGRETVLAPEGNKIRVTAKTGPQYLIGTAPVKAVRVIRNQDTPPAGYRELNPMDSLNDWRPFKLGLLAWKPNSEAYPPAVKRGRAKVSVVNDEEQGKCLEIELLRDTPPENDLTGESVYIQLRKPVPIPANSNEIAMWVKGDGGWGKIIFEIFDSEGGLFRSHYNSHHDWNAELCINYTGWRLHTYPFNAAGKIAPGPVGRWYGTGWIQKPAWISGIHLILNRKSLNPTEMKEVSAKIRLGGIGIIEAAPGANH